MYSEIRNKEVKTRKGHSCEWCDERINKGSLARYRAYIWDGDLKSGWMHLECWSAQEREDSKLIINGWMPGDYKRGTTIYAGN